jgi:hypothetical protein
MLLPRFTTKISLVQASAEPTRLSLAAGPRKSSPFASIFQVKFKKGQRKKRAKIFYGGRWKTSSYDSELEAHIATIRPPGEGGVYSAQVIIKSVTHTFIFFL